MAGIAGMAAGSRRQALSGLARAADLEQARENAGMQMKTAYKQQQMSGAMAGAGAGVMAGAEYGSSAGPWGAVIGGVIGAVIGYGASSYA